MTVPRVCVKEGSLGGPLIVDLFHHYRPSPEHLIELIEDQADPPRFIHLSDLMGEPQ